MKVNVWEHVLIKLAPDEKNPLLLYNKTHMFGVLQFKEGYS